MHLSEVFYNELEDLLLECVSNLNKNKNFLRNEKDREIFYENCFLYYRLKLERLGNVKNNYKKLVIFPKILKESIDSKQYELLKEEILDTIGDYASKAWDKTKEWGSDLVDFAKKHPVDFGQGILDLISIVDPTGLIDLVNGSIYLARGEYLSAFFCGIGVIFTLPGFVATLTGGGAVAGVPMIAAGKTLKAVLRYGGKVTAPIIKLAKFILKQGSYVSKMFKFATKLPGLSQYIKFFTSITPEFIKSVNKGGSVGEILARVFGSADNVIKAPGKTADKLITKGTELAGEETAKKLTLDIAKSKSGKVFQAATGAYTLGSLPYSKDEEDKSKEDEDINQEEPKMASKATYEEEPEEEREDQLGKSIFGITRKGGFFLDKFADSADKSSRKTFKNSIDLDLVKALS